MNPTDGPWSTADDELFDRLVDGELSEPERRDLLARLDAAPGGWRRCAFAFLESQCWQQGLGQFRQRTEPQAARRPVRRTLLGSKTSTPVAMAASFLVALALGVILREAWHGVDRPGAEPGQIARQESPVPAAPVMPVTEPPKAEDHPLAAPAGEPRQYVAIPVSTADGTAGSVRLPVTERESIDEAWLASFPKALPIDVVQALTDGGHQVRQQRRLMPLRMRDGRRLVVPYDQVEIHYVGGPAYQ